MNGCSAYVLVVAVVDPPPTPRPNATPTPTPDPNATPTPDSNADAYAPTVRRADFIGSKVSNAQPTWQAARFTTTVTLSPNPNGNWTIQAQSIVGGQIAPCNSPITLSPDPLPVP